MRPFAILVCGVILTDEQIAALKAANGGVLPDDVLFGAGEPGKEQLLVGASAAFADTPGFVKLATTDMLALRAEANAGIYEFHQAWGHAVELDDNKIGYYLGLELLPDRGMKQ